MEAADQGRQHMAVFGVVIVARPIQVGGHEADRIEAVLLTQCFAELQARDLGERVPLVRGLQRPAEQGLLFDRLLGELRIDAAAAQKQQAPHPGTPGRFDHMGLDLEVLQQKIRRVTVVGLDTAHLRGGQHHHRGLVVGKPALHGWAVFQIQLGAAGREQVGVARPLQRAADRAAGHAAVAGHEDAVAGGDQGGHD